MRNSIQAFFSPITVEVMERLSALSGDDEERLSDLRRQLIIELSLEEQAAARMKRMRELRRELEEAARREEMERRRWACAEPSVILEGVICVP